MTGAQAAVVGKRVLVAEDDYFIAKGLARSLKAAGAEVVGPVPTVAEALEALRNTVVDAAVLDINLRGEPVFAVADVLMACDVPFVFATGYSASAIPDRYAPVPRCEKPVEPQVFIRKLFGSSA